MLLQGAVGVISPAGSPGPQGLPGMTGPAVRRTHRFGKQSVCPIHFCRALLCLEVLEEKQDYLVTKYVQSFIIQSND